MMYQGYGLKVLFEMKKPSVSKIKFSSFVEISADRIKKDKIYSLSTKMTQKKLNWKCKVSLDSGLNNTIKFYKKGFKHLKYDNIEYKLKI